jgi:hypothetical protein
MRTTVAMLVLLAGCSPAAEVDDAAATLSAGVLATRGVGLVDDDVSPDDALSRDEDGDEDPDGRLLGEGAPPPPHDPTPACGEVLTHSVHLHEDIGPCGALGLEVGADDIVLDCDGHHIRGTGAGVGILLEGRAGVIVGNCHVEDFDDGLRMIDTTGNRITDNTFTRGDVDGATGDLIARNTFTGRLDLRDTRALTVEGNELNEDVVVQLALLVGPSDFGLRVHDNDVHGAVEFIDSHAVRFDANWVEGYSILVEDSHGNRFDGNMLHEAHWSVLGGDDNLFLRNQVDSPVEDGFLLWGGADHNHLRDNEVHDAGTDAFRLWLEANDNLLESNDACGSGDADLRVEPGATGTVLVHNDFCVVSGI